MSCPDSSISGPIPRNVQLLYRLLTTYPTLAAILSYSHRSDIIHLARTCQSFNLLLTASIAPLRNAFPRCKLYLTPCHVCQAFVCRECKQDVQELEKPRVVNTNILVSKALLMAPYLRRPTTSILQSLHEARLEHTLESGYLRILQDIGTRALCVACFTKHNEGQTSISDIVPVDARLLDAPTLEWNDVPHTHTRCTCVPSNQSQCVGDMYLVEPADVPVNSELVALVNLPPDQMSEPGVCALYADMSTKDPHVPDLAIELLRINPRSFERFKYPVFVSQRYEATYI